MPGQSKGKSKSTPQKGRAAAAAAAADRERAAAAAADRERAAAETAAGRAGRLQRAEAEKAAAATAATAAAATAATAAVTKRPQSPKPAASLFVRTPTKSNRAKLERRLQATATSATRAAKRKAVEEGSKATEAHRKNIEEKRLDANKDKLKEKN